jgi:phosphatidylglycerol:prolipoprotein diacylglycerol transferase
MFAAPVKSGSNVPFPDIDPIVFAIGPFAVRWYALAYLAGVALGVGYAILLVRHKSLWANNAPPLTTPQLLDFGFWVVIGIVVGGRLGYVLFYAPAYYLAHPLQIVQTWDGGMSFHGGMVGLVVVMLVFARGKGGHPLSGLDLLAAVSPIGLMLGRLANFINGELYGKITGLPWAVIFPAGGPFPRHPSQLYEALLEGLLLFLFLRYITHVANGLRRPGLVTGLFGIWYGFSRIAIEFVRLPDEQIGYLYGGWLTLGMLLSLPLILGGLTLVVIAMRARID